MKKLTCYTFKTSELSKHFTSHFENKGLFGFSFNFNSTASHVFVYFDPYGNNELIDAFFTLIDYPDTPDRVLLERCVCMEISLSYFNHIVEDIIGCPFSQYYYDHDEHTFIFIL